MANSIAFIDKRVANYLNIAGAFDGSVEVVFLDQGDDGVRQIADYLVGRSGVQSLHLISHGDQGTVTLGATDLSIATLPNYWNLLGNIGSALSDDADILFYGCNVAAGPLGQEFIRQVAEATAADVAASDDVTGLSSVGGDAVLEAKAGQVSAQMLLTQEQLDDWALFLATNSSSYSGWQRTYDITLVPGYHTFEVTDVPENYSGLCFYRLTGSANWTYQGVDDITGWFEEDADFSFSTNGINGVRIGP